jgi:bacteriocin biosynthesis cyclodehydratase domain-containing protein
MHPLLTPGAHVLRRSADEVQVGLDPARSLVLPAPARTLLSLTEEPALASALVRRGLADPDDRSLRDALPADDAGSTWVRHTLAALARRVRSDLPASLSSRDSHVVLVSAFGHATSRTLAAELTTLCARTGLRLPQPSRPGPRPRGRRRPAPVQVLVGIGEPTRDLLDGWVRDGTPHLLVRLVEGSAVVGPLVVPGQSACLRCIDAYLTEENPAWPLLVEQYARATRTDRADGIPEPVDAALAAVAVGWAAREVASYVEGTTPSSLSATIRLSPTLDTVETQRWTPHPHCGCGWP